MAEIVLSPHATLQFGGVEGKEAASTWQEQLFSLAARRVETPDPVVSCWRRFADLCLLELCHAAAEMRPVFVPEYPAAAMQGWLENSPPLPGGEYLSSASCLVLWNGLVAWCADRVKDVGSCEAFVSFFAPRWRQVGRVTVHLAENRHDRLRPFAFLVTFVDGLNAEGRPRHLPLAQALKKYVGEHDRSSLGRLLSPLEKAAECLPWLDAMVRDKTIFHPLAFTAPRAYQLLQSVPLLESCGIGVRLPDWWKQRPRPQVHIRIGESETDSLLGLDALLDFNVTASLGDMQLAEEDLQQLLKAEDGLLLFKGRWVEVNKKQLQDVLRQWNLSRKAVASGKMTFAEAMRLLAGMPDGRLKKRSGDSGVDLNWQQVDIGEGLGKRLAALRAPGAAEPPSTLHAVLRPYQKEGLAWLYLLTGMGLGACLADDMGLGKTMQVLALLLLLQHKEGEGRQLPSLLVLPASLLANWRDEAAHFAPDLRLAFLHPSETPKNQQAEWLAHPEKFRAFDVVVTTYTLLVRYVDVLGSFTWQLLILDEAQAIKNASTRQAKAVLRIRSSARIAMTGTPVENRLDELWSLFNCINPGLLGTASQFASLIDNLSHRQENRYAPLRKLVSPYILRRMKTDKRIIADLPEKTETVVYCNLVPEQVKLYEQVVGQLKKMLRDLAAGDEQARSLQRRGLILQSVSRLKQICNHPDQLLGTGDFSPARSGKLQRVGELCAELAERQDRLLVFTQYQEIIPPLCHFLEGIFHRPGLALHGGVSVGQRKDLVDAFQSPDGPPFFVLSLRAGGTGLNLTAANHVLHFDRWWNPAVEHQATDRAFRIGQKRSVFVHTCVVRGTIEERIDEMLRKKEHLAGEILDESGDETVNLAALDDKALMDILRLDMSKAQA